MNGALHELLPESDDPITKAYIEIIKHGLPKTVSPKKIAIVGAGMAGLVSAQLLSEAGHDVTIFEGNTRIGGRIHTLRGEKYFGRSDLYGEAGAMRLPLQIHHLLRTYICKYAVPINYFFQVDVKKDTVIDQNQNAVVCEGGKPTLPEKANNAWPFVNGIKMRTSEYLCAEYPGKTLGYHLERLAQSQQKMTGPELLKDVTGWVKDFVNQNPRLNWPDAIERYDQYSIHGFFKEFSLLDGMGIEYLEVLQNLESRANLSFIQNLIEISLINSDNTYWEISNGTDNLVSAWFEPLRAAGVKVYFNEWIDTVEWSENKVAGKLSFSPYDKDWDGQVSFGAKLAADGFIEEFDADEIILTVPVPCMRTMSFVPMLPHVKRKMIRELYFDSAAKILLSFSKRFWEEDDHIYGGGSITDLANRTIYYPSHRFGEDDGVILASYTWETEARGWGSLTNEQRVEFALDGVAKVHGEGIRQYFIKGISWFWDEIPFAMGEAAMFAPGQLSELQDHVATPVGRLHFAGDWTTLRHAWIEGAIESGIRVALEIDPTDACRKDELMLRPLPVTIA